MTDAELLEAWGRTGAQDAFAELIARHRDRVYSTCLRILRNTHAAEDATQATFLVLAEKGKELTRVIVLAGWLHGVARACALKWLRTERRRMQYERVAAEERIHETAGREDGWEAIASHLDKALGELSVSHRDAVMLRFMSGLSEAEAAAEMGCSVCTLHARVAAGLSKLRDKLQRRKISLSAGALALLLQKHATQSVPPDLAAALQATCLGKTIASSSVQATVQAVLPTVAGSGLKLSWMFAFLVAGVLALPALYYGLPAALRPNLSSSSSAGTEVDTLPPTPPARPVPNTPVAPVNPGGRLDDASIWHRVGTLPMRISADRVEIDMANPDARSWKSASLLHRKRWDLSKGPVTVRLKACGINQKGKWFTRLVAMPVAQDISFEQMLSQFSNFRPSGEGGNSPPLPTWQVSKVVATPTELVFFANEEVVKRTPIPREPAYPCVYLGFQAGAKDTREEHTFIFTDVQISQTPSQETEDF